jgi:tRNA U34 5-methylaminomethyl-2-thiouridine-forming methyltransferase MnmC
MTPNDYEALTPNFDVLKIIEQMFKDEKKGNKKARDIASNALNKYIIRTNDGSSTFRSNTFQGNSEAMHTHIGAISESKKKFVSPAKLEGKKRVRVLDICSGLGYNAASCIEFLDDEVEIEIDMVEISPETLALSLILDNPVNSYKIIKKSVENKLYKEGLLYFRLFEDEIPNRININIYLDDARAVVQELIGTKKYDAIFLDPFSPLLSPELYSYEFFIILKNLLLYDGLILTYTSAAPVRAAIIKCGLQVGEGPPMGRSGGTIASLNPELIEKSLKKDDERMIALSDAGTPFRDPDLIDSPHSIIQRRNQERETLRGKRKFASTVKTPIYLFEQLDDGRLKRRVLRNSEKLGFPDLNSFESRYVVCPQYNNCICGEGCKRYNNSHDRTIEMSHRLRQILN